MPACAAESRGNDQNYRYCPVKSVRESAVLFPVGKVVLDVCLETGIVEVVGVNSEHSSIDRLCFAQDSDV